jgi:hypothetical protein
MAVATAVAIGGLAISAGSAAMSFAQAGKQSRLQREAEAKAAQAMAEARKKLEVNFAKNLSIQKEPYELAREAMLSSGAQSIQAAIESDRGAEVTAGKVQMAQNQGQADIRGVMGQELTDINKQIINEDSRLRDLNTQLDLGEVEGAQLEATDSQEARSAAMTEGFQGLASTAQQGLEMANLYEKDKNAFRDFSDATVTGSTTPTTPNYMSPINQQFKNNTLFPSVGAVNPFSQLSTNGRVYNSRKDSSKPIVIDWSGLGY